MDTSACSDIPNVSNDDIHVCDIMVKKEFSVQERSGPCLVVPRPKFNSPIIGSKYKQNYDIKEIEKQIIPKKKLTRKCNNESTSTDTIFQFDKSRLFADFMGSLQSRYTAKEYVQHNFKIKSKQIFQNSKMDIRNGDWLIRVNDNDMTLLSHNEASEIIEASLGENENITLDYFRPYMDTMFHAEVNLCSSGETLTVTSSPREQWHIRTVMIQCRGNLKFMQQQDNEIIFKEQVSPRGNRRANEMHMCHFIEESKMIFSDNDMILERRFKTECSKEYLNVTDDGRICLHDDDSTTFLIKATHRNAYSKIEECEKYRLLCVEGHSQFGHFVEKKYEDSLSDNFKFNIEKIKCLR